MVAYTNLPIVRKSIRSDTPAHLIADLDAILTSAGWATKSAVTGGFKYTLTSPDGYGFQAKVLVIDAANYAVPADLYNHTSVVVQFMSADETNKGFPNQLNTGVWPGMQVVAGICQLFISVPGQSGTGFASVAGGIPSVQPDSGPCVSGLPALSITDIWWSCGPTQFGNDFRKSANCYAGSTYCFNGVMFTTVDDNTVDSFAGRLCLFPLTPVNSYSNGQTFYPAITYSSHKPICFDAFIGWEWRIRGQLWDAFLQSAATGLDVVRSFVDVDATGAEFTVQAIAWHSHDYSTLQLIFGGPVPGSAGGLGNYAF